MNYECLLIRFGELNTKGKNKQNFIDLLFKNIKKALLPFEQITLQKAHDRIYVYLNGAAEKPIVKVLQGISGIANLSLVIKVENEIDKIVESALQMAQSKEVGTFKVVTRRSEKRFPIHSDEVNRLVATKVLQNSEHKVDVHHPTFYIEIEIRQEGTFIFFDKIKGLGGYPLGIGGKTLVLFSGGIDSPVAAYNMMKRGVKIEAIHFASPPYTSQGARQKVIDLIRVLAKIQGPIALHIVPFTKLQEAIYDAKDESYAITLMRRMMYRISERVANKRNCLVLTSGESIGQVASQTLESMRTINEVIKIPMIRPLATMDKNEIIEMAKNIGTYELSILPFVDCCTIFTPHNPVTRPTIARSEEIEARFDYEKLIQDCLDGLETLYIDEDYSPEREAEQFL